MKLSNRFEGNGKHRIAGASVCNVQLFLPLCLILICLGKYLLHSCSFLRDGGSLVQTKEFLWPGIMAVHTGVLYMLRKLCSSGAGPLRQSPHSGDHPVAFWMPQFSNHRELLFSLQHKPNLPLGIWLSKGLQIESLASFLSVGFWMWCFCFFLIR